MSAAGSRRFRGWRRWATAGAVAAAVAVATAYVLADAAVERYLRPATIRLLEDRLRGTVELAALEVDVWPSLRVRGEGLVVRFDGRTDIPPLISVRAFSIAGRTRALWRREIDRVQLEGLAITIPPGRLADLPKRRGGGAVPDILIHDLGISDGAIVITSKRPDKPDQEYALHAIQFRDFQFDRASAYTATLTIPTPTGDVASHGTFGPWIATEPRTTPVDGQYTFTADLASISGIRGALDATGSFAGPLQAIRSRGSAAVKDFRLSSGGAAFPLAVTFDALVDATNGDTHLNDVRGRLADTQIAATGAIVGIRGVKGRALRLETTTTQGRLADLLRLTTEVTTSPMEGLVDMVASIGITPGPGDVLDRLDLGGTFSVASVRFTSQTIQDRIDELSRRGRGRPTDMSIDNVASNLRGRFQLKARRLRVPAMSFSVRGAEVRLAGAYDLPSQRLDFTGTLRLQARASRTQTGWRSMALRLFDPLLDEKGAGTVLPISITGPSHAPKFGADIKKAIFK